MKRTSMVVLAVVLGISVAAGAAEVDGRERPAHPARDGPPGAQGSAHPPRDPARSRRQRRHADAGGAAAHQSPAEPRQPADLPREARRPASVEVGWRRPAGGHGFAPVRRWRGRLAACCACWSCRTSRTRGRPVRPLGARMPIRICGGGRRCCRPTPRCCTKDCGNRACPCCAGTRERSPSAASRSSGRPRAVSPMRWRTVPRGPRLPSSHGGRRTWTRRGSPGGFRARALRKDACW